MIKQYLEFLVEFTKNEVRFFNERINAIKSEFRTLLYIYDRAFLHK